MPALQMNRLRLFLFFLIVLLPFATQAFRFGESPRAAAEITVAQLPTEGRATLALIKRGGPFLYSKDGTTFGNREGLLPQQPRGHYKEYTVPTPGLNHRGTRRIVAGGGIYWYTADHYRSFRRIKE